MCFCPVIPVEWADINGAAPKHLAAALYNAIPGQSLVLLLAHGDRVQAAALLTTTMAVAAL